jgi:hypothetical protein
MDRNLGYSDHFVYEVIEKFFQGQNPEKINNFFRDYPGRTQSLQERADSELAFEYQMQDVPGCKNDLAWLQAMVNFYNANARWQYRGYWILTNEGRIEINPAFK